MNILTQSAGNRLAIGIHGTREERERIFNLFFNWGAVAPGIGGKGEESEFARLGYSNGETGERGADFFHELREDTENKPGFSYFFADFKDIFRALCNKISVDLQMKGESKRFKRKPQTFCWHCMRAAMREIKSWREENFLGNRAVSLNYHRQLDGGAPFWAAEFEE